MNDSKKFRYTRKKVNNSIKNVDSITFNISMTGIHQRKIYFLKPVGRLTAIRRIENFLSAPLTKDYYDMVKDDSFNITSRRVINLIRGDLLGNSKYIDTIHLNDGEMWFES
jgi:hypothetical protein